jgi:hypothetical protein
MAIVTLSELISNLRGSIGQTTFSNNPAGLIAKRKITHPKTYTSKQQAVILTHSNLVGQWQRLSLVNKDLWNDFASLHTRTNRYGLLKVLTGWNWFAAINYMNLLFNQELSTTPLPYRLPSSVPSYTVELSDSAFAINLSTKIYTDSTHVLIFATLPSRSTAQIPRSQYRLIAIQKADSLGYRSLTSAWDSVFSTSYVSLASTGRFIIGAFIVPVDSISLVEGVGTASRGEWNPTGIGYMAIGSSFIVG